MNEHIMETIFKINEQRWKNKTEKYNIYSVLLYFEHIIEKIIKIYYRETF